MSKRALPGAGLAVVLLALAGCSSVSNPIPTEVPTAQTVAGLEPSGTVTMTQVFVSGVGAGKGVLAFQGKTYPFKLVGTVIGYGSLSKAEVAGDVYKLEDISQFSGPWIEGTGVLGLETAAKTELWLQNKAGVVMHLTGKQEGVTLGLGKDELVIELGKPTGKAK